MKRSFLNVAGALALTAAMAFGQNAPRRPQAAGPGRMLDRVSADLNLSDTQKQQAESIFSAARQSAEAVQAQIRTNREALTAAAKSGASDAQIDGLSSALGPLLAQSTAIQTKAFAKFYGILTAEQRDKLGNRVEGLMNGFGGGSGRGSRGRRAPGE